MKCKIARKMMSAFIDGEVSPTEKESLTRHMQDCNDCRELHEEMLAIRDLFAVAEKHTAPWGFSQRVMTKLGEELESGRIFRVRTPFFLKLAEIGFAIVIIIVGIISGNILMMKSHGPERPPGIETSFSLDAFDPAPFDSLGGAYISMTEVRNER